MVDKIHKKKKKKPYPLRDFCDHNLPFCDIDGPFAISCIHKLVFFGGRKRWSWPILYFAPFLIKIFFLLINKKKGPSQVFELHHQLNHKNKNKNYWVCEKSINKYLYNCQGFLLWFFNTSVMNRKNCKKSNTRVNINSTNYSRNFLKVHMHESQFNTKWKFKN